MRVQVYYDRYGHIVSVVSPSAEESAPPAGIFPLPDSESFDLDLSEEQERQPLIQLHTQYRLDLSGHKPKLVPITRDRKIDPS
jgi:hypothetical protein